MINLIWSAMILLAIAFAYLQADPELVTTTIFQQGARGVAVSLEVMSIIVIWFGLSRVANKAGLLPALGRAMAPLLQPFFPGIPKKHPSLSAISMNIAANMLGLANAATPFGLQAMKHLQKLNHRPRTITPAMATFLVLNSTCATLVPTTAIALRATAGSKQPSEIILPAFLASSVAVVSVLILDRVFRCFYKRGGGE